MNKIKANYKDLLKMYHVASKHYIKTNSTRLLAYTLRELETFERAYATHYGLDSLYALQAELGEAGLAIV